MKSSIPLGIAKEIGETLSISSKKASGYFTFQTASHMPLCTYYVSRTYHVFGTKKPWKCPKPQVLSVDYAAQKQIL